MSITVYSAITNDYDFVQPQQAFPNVNYVLFTDNPAIDAEGWEVRFDRDLDRVRCKLMAHECLDCEYSIWVDGNMTFTQTPEIIVRSVLHEADFAAFRHPSSRCCTYQEGALWNKCLPRVKGQMHFYQNKMFPVALGLMETSIVARKHNAATQAFNELWWETHTEFGTRDELSVMYALWATGLNHKFLMGSKDECQFCDVSAHKKVIPDIVWG